MLKVKVCTGCRRLVYVNGDDIPINFKLRNNGFSDERHDDKYDWL